MNADFPRNRGFSLLELLVAVAIVATLACVTCLGVTRVKQRAAVATEVASARNLISAYLCYAADNHGALLPGYKIDTQATNTSGKPLGYPLNARYPWRIAPYLERLEGSILCNGNERLMQASEADYLISVHPNFGINAVLVGGHYGSGSPLPPTPRLIAAYGQFYAARLHDVPQCERQLVFASARMNSSRVGYFEIRPPRLTRALWSAVPFSPSSAASQHGFVDFRHHGKAVCAMLGGNILLLQEDQLRDMRLWSLQAQLANDPHFELSRSQSSSR